MNQLSKDGITGVVDLVESMHQRIYSLGGLLNQGDLNKTTGLTGLIYQSIRKTTQLSTHGVNLALQTFAPMLPFKVDDKKRTNWLSIMNGVIGDHLEQTDNPLAMDMSWHHRGQQLTPQQAAECCNRTPGKVLFLIHGLCMNDLQWSRQGHNHGQALAAEHNITTIYLRYNSGLAVYQNGHQLAAMMAEFVQALTDDKSIDVLCHSMGGLVLRSAMHVASMAAEEWLNKINKVIFLGTPHQGAVLEKTGNLIDYLISINPYSAPFAKLGHTRSHGIKNLRHGTVTKDHQIIQLPKQIKCYAFAASNAQNDANILHKKWIGDGLVTVHSALGHHKNPEHEINFPQQHQLIFKNINHMNLLSDRGVFNCIDQIINHSV
ncbi:hypothetical protein OS175_09085 [Marinicella sp. S1101]|uniref:esterase/lipase family protein n=1 Tax=Marinicella marina TaxID=2996016 RepID=UPI002260A175|nr:hypothetical protein [Marinicella marina]MCX7554030.1 hypothetical protein [Marinicella marina]MDJ1140522.1 hypothetical protein [Marinicella marina]